MRCEIEVGQDLVTAFARLTADRSAIHVDPEFARKTRFRGTVVHGMLPVLLLLNRLAAAERPAPRVWLKELSCRFTGAVRAGERLCLAAEPGVDGEVETWTFSITRLSDGGRATERQGRASPLFRHGGRASGLGAVDRLLDGAIEESRSTPADLAVGLAEALTFAVEPLAAAPLLDAAGAGSPTGGFDDAGAMAALMASTLIGMRLPGRHATFLDLDVAFPGPIARDDRLTLRGTVAEIAPAGGRMRLDLQWTGRRGSGRPRLGLDGDRQRRRPRPSTCAEIRRDHHAGAGLAGRTAMVTGASRGIGEATAKLLAMQGARVAVHYFRGRADAEAIVADIRNNGGEAVALQADLADQASVGSALRGGGSRSRAGRRPGQQRGRGVHSQAVRRDRAGRLHGRARRQPVRPPCLLPPVCWLAHARAALGQDRQPGHRGDRESRSPRRRATSR